MSGLRFAYNALIFLFLISLPLGVSADAAPWITAYYLDNSISPNDVPWSKITHVIHFAVTPSDVAGGIQGISDANADALTTAAHNAGVKALLCVRDNNSNLTYFAAALRNNPSGFVNNVAAFVNAHNYDGVDLDWEADDFASPQQNSYVNLIMGLRTLLGTDKIITISVYWNQKLASVVQRAADDLDQINVMCYDMDQWIGDTYYNSATYGPFGDMTHNSCAAMTGNYSSYVPASKIGIGIPFYGRVWSGCWDSACSDGLHAPFQAWSAKPTSKSIHYNALVASSYWSYPHLWDSMRSASYISIDQPGAANDRFISFTDEKQINALVQLMRDKGYGGVMEYEIEYDFISWASGDDRHPLATAVYNAIFGSQQ